MPTRSLRLLVLGTTLALFACGNDDDGGGNGNPEPTTNTAPSFTAPANQTGTEDTPGTVAVTGINANDAGQTVTMSVTSNNPTLLPTLTVSAVADGAATISYTPAADQSGTAEITVTANDGQTTNATSSSKFTLTIAAAEDAPKFTASPSVQSCAGSGRFTLSDISPGGGADEASQTVTVEVIDMSNPTRATNITVGEIVDGKATVTYDFEGGVVADTVLLVTAEDSAGKTETFQVTVEPPDLVGFMNTLVNRVENESAKIGVTGLMYVKGVTDQTGAGEGIVAHVGVGPTGTDPSTDGDWTWTAATYMGDENSETGPDFDVHGAWVPTPAPAGHYDVAMRYSCGTHTEYFDTDGNEYTSAKAGKLESVAATSTNVGFCNLNRPTTVPGDIAFAQTFDVFGEAHVQGATDQATAATELFSEVGIGPISTDPDAKNPLTGAGWRYFAGSPNGSWDFANTVNDEHVTPLTAPLVSGTYHYVYRFRTSTGGWLYCDTDRENMMFDPELLGTVVVP